MNKTININLGGIPLIIDEDAYTKLDYYLTAIHNHFKTSEGYEEITSDIESRMGELFVNQLKGRTIITAKDVDATILIMGSLEDFGAIPEQEYSKKYTGSSSSQYKTGRRVFRDPDDKIIGGVCSGLSAYFGINDPIWLRIIFALLFFAAGTGFLFYLILMIIIPKAQTTADRLAMRGAPININSIAKEVEQGINTIGSKINEFSKDFSGQKKNEFVNSDGHAMSGLSSFLSEIVDAIKFIIPKIIKAFVIMIGLICLVAIVIAGIAMLTSSIVLHNFTDLFFGPQLIGQQWLLFTSVALFFLLPTLILAILGFKAILKTKTPRALISGLGILWFINIFIGLGSGFSYAKSFKHPYETSSNLNYFENINPDTLTLDANEEDGFSDFEFDNINLGFLKTKNDKFYSSDIRVKILKSDVPNISWRIDYLSNGSSSQESESLAKSIEYQVKQDGQRLIFPKYFEIQKGKLWRNQKVRIFVYCPEGKYCRITSRAESLVTQIEKDPDQDEVYEYSNTVWKMGKEGFINTKPKSEKEDTSDNSDNDDDDTQTTKDTI